MKTASVVTVSSVDCHDHSDVQDMLPLAGPGTPSDTCNMQGIRQVVHTCSMEEANCERVSFR